MSNVDTWLIVGSRRWARVMASELCAVTNSVIQMLCENDDSSVRHWLKKTGLEDRINLVESLERCCPTKTGVALIVNSAYRHRHSIEEALSAGYNVVSEKPISFSEEEAVNLINYAQRLGLKFFCTNTYLFADYLNDFKNKWLSRCQFTEVHIFWWDAILETRYGETKAYDSSVPVIFDVLPHIANLIRITIGENTPRAVELSVQHGGSEVYVKYRCESININIWIVRNAKHRKRCIKLSGLCEEVSLDFTSEPGVVVVNDSQPISIDANWCKKPKPIAAMFKSLIECFELGIQDERLSPVNALLGNKLIDAVVDDYVRQQVSLLSAIGLQITEFDEDFNYAFKEASSIQRRVFPYLEQKSSLRQLALAADQVTI